MLGDADNDFGLVIGIARYPYLKSLESPRQDALEFAGWLKGGAGVPAARAVSSGS